MKRFLIFWGSRIFNGLVNARASETCSRIEKYIGRDDKILDIGTGTGHLTNLLIAKGHKITPIDVVNISVFKNLNPTIYDGENIPYKDNSFDTALLVTVLHHIKNPEKVLKEAKRVAKRIIIVEDVYKSNFQKNLTFIMDSVTNLEFSGHPHSNKSAEEWLHIFRSMKLKTRESKYYTFWKFFTSAVFFLEKLP